LIFKIAPKVRLGVGETEQDVSLGQKVFEDADKKTLFMLVILVLKILVQEKLLIQKRRKI